MPVHDIIVIGASSGGVSVLSSLVAMLPEDLPAAVFIVLHVRADVPSHLPAILNRTGRLPAAHAVDREPVRRGRIYVAPPGMQTYLQRGRICVKRGPHENSQRPAIDALFRTAAHHYGPRVIGIVLSGALDDGSAGLAAVKRAGGIAIVQDPDEAAFRDMPAHALEAAEVDFRLRTVEIGPIVDELVRKPGADLDPDEIPREVPLETAEETGQSSETTISEALGPPSAFTCPDCSGTLFQIDDGPTPRFRCRVGHAFAEASLESAQHAATERALWVALRSLHERNALLRRLADSARRRGHNAAAIVFEQRQTDIEADVTALHRLIAEGGALESMAGQRE